jgi:hypothetical protein
VVTAAKPTTPATPLQRRIGLRGQGQEAFEELGDGNFARAAKQETAAAGDGFGVNGLEPSPSGRQVLLESMKEGMRVGDCVWAPIII